MFAERHTYLEKGMSSVMAALILLTTAGQSVSLIDPSSTPSPTVVDSMLTTGLFNGSVEEPRVLRTHRPCREEHADFCIGGECIYPQDSDKPSCNCRPLYSGHRCSSITAPTQTAYQYEEMIGLSVGVAVLIFVLILLFCCIRKRCTKSASLIKSDGSENSV
ncbi:epigen-like [Polymixia lowei]